MYVQIENKEYPVSEAQIRERHPEWCYPDPFEPCDGYAYVTPTEPPEHNPATHRAVASAAQQGDVWAQVWSLVKLKAAEVSEALAAEKGRLLAEVTARRYDVETGGIALPNGIRLDTQRADQDAITRVLANAPFADIAAVPFKAASGWVDLTIDELKGVAAAIALHVQACYAAERAHHDAIAGLSDLAAALAYDTAQGWPS